MSTIVRSTRPSCPACGFPVYNRRCATCEKCRAMLPSSIAYTADELLSMRQRERVDEEARSSRMAKVQAARAQRGVAHLGRKENGNTSGVADAVEIAIDIAGLFGD